MSIQESFRTTQESYRPIQESYRPIQKSHSVIQETHCPFQESCQSNYSTQESCCPTRESCCPVQKLCLATAPPPCSYRREIHVLFPHVNWELLCKGIFILCFPMSTGNCYAHTYGKSSSCFLMTTGNCLVHTDGNCTSFVFSCRQGTATPVMTENHLRLVCFIVFFFRFFFHVDHVYIAGC